jgi:nucleolar protein 12
MKVHTVPYSATHRHARTIHFLKTNFTMTDATTTPSNNATLVLGGGRSAGREPASKPPTTASLVDSIFGKSQSSRNKNDHGDGNNNKSTKKRTKSPRAASTGGPTNRDDGDPSGQVRLASLFGEEVAQELRDADAARKESNQQQQQQQQLLEAAKAAPRRHRKDPPLSAGGGDDDDDDGASSSSEPSSHDNPDIRSPKKRKKERKQPKEGDNTAATVEQDGAKKQKDDSETDKDATGDDADAEDRTVFVGNLPLGTTRKTLEALFRGNGVCVDPLVDRVASARIRRVPTQGVKLPPQHAGNQALVQKVAANAGLFDSTKSSSCVGYVVFAHPSTVERALELNNMEIPDPTADEHHGQSKARHIRVDRVRPVHDAARSVFVGNLPHNRTDEETLRQHVIKACSLQQASNNDDQEDDPIEAVRVVRDGEFQCRGFAYVLLRDKSLVPHVLQQLADSTYQGRQLRVQVCGKRFKNRRGEPKPAAAPEMALSPYAKHGRDKKRHRGGDLVAAAAAASSSASASAAQPSPMGALRRIMASQAADTKGKSRRARGPTMASKRAAGGGGAGPTKSPHKVPKRAAASSSSSANVKSSGGSKRSASQSKSHDRAKKIEKRMSRGMGKNKKSAGR